VLDSVISQYDLTAYIYVFQKMDQKSCFEVKSDKCSSASVVFGTRNHDKIFTYFTVEQQLTLHSDRHDAGLNFNITK